MCLPRAPRVRPRPRRPPATSRTDPSMGKGGKTGVEGATGAGNGSPARGREKAPPRKKNTSSPFLTLSSHLYFPPVSPVEPAKGAAAEPMETDAPAKKAPKAAAAAPGPKPRSKRATSEAGKAATAAAAKKAKAAPGPPAPAPAPAAPKGAVGSGRAAAQGVSYKLAEGDGAGRVGKGDVVEVRALPTAET